MLKQEKLPFRLSFRCDDPTLEGLEDLSVKLGLGQSEVLRIAVKRLMEQCLSTKSDIILMDRPDFDKIVHEFTDGITKNSEKMLARQESIFKQIIQRIFEQPGIKEILKSVDIDDIKIQAKQS